MFGVRIREGIFDWFAGCASSGGVDGEENGWMFVGVRGGEARV